jgi:hypothetical protein
MPDLGKRKLSKIYAQDVLKVFPQNLLQPELNPVYSGKTILYSTV